MIRWLTGVDMTARDAAVSVVIPAFNCVDVLLEQLEAVAAQECEQHWEVVVADNGSADGTRQLAERFADSHSRFRVIDASRAAGASAARNDGAEAARGAKILFCDADDVVGPDWIQQLAAALDREVAVGGWLSTFVSTPGDIDVGGRPAVASFGTEHFLISACMGIRRDVFDEVGGFDETWGPGEDIDLSLRLIHLGHRLGRVDDATVFKRVTTAPRAVWKQHFRYGVQRARAAAAFPEFKGPVRLRDVLRKWAWVVAKLPLRWRDRDVLGPSAMACGRLVGSIRYRVFYP